MEEIRYETVGQPLVSLTIDEDGGVQLTCNSDGFRSLMSLLSQFVDSEAPEWAHIHLTPGMQLAAGSLGLTVARSPRRLGGEP
jgi:hypothetical protein